MGRLLWEIVLGRGKQLNIALAMVRPGSHCEDDNNEGVTQTKNNFTHRLG